MVKTAPTPNCFRKKESHHVTPLESLLLGMASGAAAQFVASPGDLAKVQMQTEGRMRAMGFEPRGDSLLDILRREVREGGGVRALWKGEVEKEDRVYCTYVLYVHGLY